MIFKGIRLTARQRETLGKIFINTGNGFWIAWVLGNLVGEKFRPPLLLWGFFLYVVTGILAVWVDR